MYVLSLSLSFHKQRSTFSRETQVPKGEEAMKLAILYGGPVTASIKTFPGASDLNKHTGDGVFMGEREGTPSSGGHAIVLFGWGKDGSTPFWWARNTWGRNWPKRASTPGIFKIHRGSNRNEIESGETVFSLVSNIPIPSVGDLKSAFPGSQAMCNGISSSSKNVEAVNCISIENRPNECVLENTCADKIVSITETTSNSVVSKSSSDRETCGRYISEGTTLGPRQKYSIEGVTDCCVLNAEIGEGAAKCMELKREDRCEIKNRCTESIQVKFKNGNRITSINGAFGSGSESSVDMKFCGEEYEMQTFNTRGRPVNAEACFTRSVGHVCLGTNRCGKAMRVKISRGSGFSYLDFDPSSGDSLIVNDKFCEPGVQTEEL